MEWVDMSLTESQELFAAIHEDAINTFVTAFFTARPRYLHIGTSFFVPSTNVNHTQVDAIDLGGGIHFQILLSQPAIDLHPQSEDSLLPPGPNQFSLTTAAKLSVLCVNMGNDKEPRGETKTTEIEICATGHVERISNKIQLLVDEIEIKDIKPDSLEDIIECIMKAVINDALAQIQIPYQSFYIQIGTIIPSGDPPFIDDDNVTARANFS
jgi:hypothetical protein